MRPFARACLIFLLAALVQTGVQAESIFRIEVNDEGKAAIAHLPRIDDLESFWVMEEVVNEVVFRDARNYERFLSDENDVLTERAPEKCSTPRACDLRKLTRVLKTMEEVFIDAMANPFVYDGKGFKITYRYLGSRDFTIYQSYDVLPGSSRIFKGGVEDFTYQRQKYWCSQLPDNSRGLIKSVSIIKGLTPEPFNIELSGKVCDQLEAPAG